MGRANGSQPKDDAIGVAPSRPGRRRPRRRPYQANDHVRVANSRSIDRQTTASREGAKEASLDSWLAERESNKVRTEGPSTRGAKTLRADNSDVPDPLRGSA